MWSVVCVLCGYCEAGDDALALAGRAMLHEPSCPGPDFGPIADGGA